MKESFSNLESQEVSLSPELSGVEKEVALDRLKNERAGLLSKIFTRKNVETAALLTPGIDIVGLTAFAARGETLAGKTLDGRERVNYVAAAGFLATFYAMHFAGMEKEAIAARGIAATIATVEFGPELFQWAKSFAGKRIPSMVPFIEKTATFLEDKIGVVKNAQRSMMEDLAVTGPEPLAFDLDG